MTGRRQPGPEPGRGARPTRATARPSTRFGGGRAGPRGRVRRPGFTAPRAAALLGLLASVGALYGLAATPAFTFARAEIPALRWTEQSAVEAAIAVPVGTNLFQLEVAPIEARLRELPGIAEARVVVALPDSLQVSVEEREAIVAWGVGEQRFLVDRDGVLFAIADPGAVTEAGLPLVADTRPDSAGLAVGSVLDPLDLDAATRLASLTPEDIESVADALLVTLNVEHGFVVGTSPTSWIAIFGIYTPSVRTPEIIPGQVRLLRSLLSGREATVAQVILSGPDRGTFIPRATPAP